jgi:OPT family oligopeptide transporter
MNELNKANPIKENTDSIPVIEDEKYYINSRQIDPIDDREPDDGIPYQFTWRAAIIGSLLGYVVAASNLYSGLKFGWSFGASFFGAILGFSIIKPMERLPTYLGGGPFGIKENCSVQTAAASSGGFSAGFTGAIPALFRLGILTDIDAIWTQMFLWTLAAAFYGLFFAIPLRKYYIIQQNLVFPSPTATAVTIRSLHAVSDEGSTAKKQSQVIIWSFLATTIYQLLSFFVPFIYDLHIFYWIGNASNSQAIINIDTVWNWYIELNFSFIGGGMLMGTNTVLSIALGCIFAWAITSPILFNYTEGIVNKVSPWGFHIGNDGTITCQMWLLWVGVVVMVCGSFTEIFCQYKSLVNSFKGIYIFIYNKYAKATGRLPKQIENESYDPVPDSEQVQGWQWGIGLFISTIFTVLILQFYFSIQWYLGLLSILLSFALSLVATQCAGDTDINPSGVIGKTSQFIFAPINQATIQLTQNVNLTAGNIATTCAHQTVRMVKDLKTGHLLRASPKSQFYAQIVGSLFGVVIAPVMFWIFSKAYPCILVNSVGANKCPFPAPAVNAWYGVTMAMTTKVSQSIPKSCQIACLVLGLITIVTTILKRTYLKKYAKWIPNWTAFGIACTNQSPNILLASVYGLCIAEVWKRYKPEQFKNYNISLASGFIAGNGIGGLLQAVFTISGLVQENVSTNFGCPPKGC